MAPQIPDRWLNYQPIGDRIEGTRFIAFKVPLREHVNKNVNETNQLHGKLLLEKVPNLGVIIDLTNTNRYYDPNFFKKEGVDHHKLMIPGHVTPPPRLVNRFKEFVKQFIQNNPDNDKLIGVHCTHGVNRTGYLICNYMVSEMAIDPVDAIRKFAEARGHKIERQNYVDSLHSLNSENVQEEDKNDDKTIAPQINEKRKRNDDDIEERVAKVHRDRNWRHTDRRTEHRNEQSREQNNRRNDINDSRSYRRILNTNVNPNRFQWRRDPGDVPNPSASRPSVPMPSVSRPSVPRPPVPRPSVSRSSVPLPIVERKRKAFDDDIRPQPYHRSNHPPPAKVSKPYDHYNNSNSNRYNNNNNSNNTSNERYSRDNRNYHNDYRTKDFNNKRPSHLSHPSTSNCDSRTNRSIRTDYHKDSRTNSQQHHKYRSATSSRHHQ